MPCLLIFLLVYLKRNGNLTLMTKIILPKSGRWLYGVFKGLELSGIGKANGGRIVFSIDSCFSFGIPFLIYFALMIILPHEKK